MGALDEWQSLLNGRCITDTAAYTTNLTEFRARNIIAILQPQSVNEVQHIVTIASKHRTPLWPISTGKNWGLGSRLPVTNGCAIVDLGLMNRIIEINEELHYALIEPGVTQRQLADRLADKRYMLNVTGSGEHTSIVGNVLERGVGVLGPRANDLRGLEAVLVDGLVRTGAWAFDSAKPAWHHFPQGLGPDVTGLFLQSGMGIITKMAINLHPRQHVELGVVWVPNDELEQHIDTLRQLRQLQLLRDRIETNSDDDPRLAGLEPINGVANAWMTWVVLWGEPALTAPVKQLLSKHFPKIVYYSEEDINMPKPVATRLKKLTGEPGDEYIGAMAGKPINSISTFAYDDDPANTGFVCLLPAIPFSGRLARQAVSIVKKSSEALGVHAELTLNSLSTSLMEGFFRVRFDRTDKAQVKAAHRWAKQAQQALADAGFVPTRTNIDNMDYHSGHLKMMLAIKKSIDPAGIIAPGRYIPAKNHYE